MKIFDARLRMLRKHLAVMHAAVLMFALVATTIPFPVIAQDAAPPPATEETTIESAPEEPEAPAETPEVPDGLTDDTKPPVAPDEPETPDVSEAPELPEPPEGTLPTTDEDAPQGLQMMMLTALDETPQEGQCVIVSDETTLEGGDAAVEVSEPHHTSWTAVVDALAKWIWGEDPIADPVNETEQTFTKTFSLEDDSAGAELIIAADNSYIVELDGEVISDPLEANVEDNYHAGQEDTIQIDSGDLDAGTHTLTFTVRNWEMNGGTPASNPAGLLYKLTIDGTDCGEPEEPETATIVAQKIVCPDESMLPNWGDHTDDADQAVNITEETVADFLEEHPSCYLAPDWQFEWVTDEDSNTNPGDNGGVAGTPWSLFGPTDGDGMVTVEVPAGGKVWVREVLKDGFIPFTGQNTDQNVSAEIYCSTDVLNYDNWDWIDPVEAGETYHCVAFNAPKTATVKMCKTDTEQEPLSGWQLTLTGDEVGSVEVMPDGDDYAIEDVPAGDYVVTAHGQYVYRPGDAAASTSDAAYSLRLPSDSVYGGTFIPWVRVNDFPMPYTGWLGIMLNGAVTDWGSVFNPAHDYAHGTSTGTLGDFVFRILDDVYSDNSGSLAVDLHEGYTGVTGEDGCVTFENVPYGTYEADEILQEGWTMVSGTGSVVVDSPSETFTIVNTDEEPPPADSAYIVAAKVVCDSEVDLPNNQMGKPITAQTAQDWVAQSQGKCHLESGWEFEWGNQNAGDGGSATIGHAANYTTFGPTDVNGVASTYVPLAGITTIQMREVLKEGYVPFTNSSNNVSAEFYCANDAAGYDNWEWITNPQAGATYHCVAFNAPTGPVDDGQSSITIVKESMGGTGTFSVNVKDAAPLMPESFDWDAVITTTVAGAASSTMQFAPPDTYTVEEDVPEGWDLTSVSCTGEVATTNPLTVTISTGEDVICTFVNTKEVVEEPTTLKVHIYKYLETDGIAQIGNGSGAPDFPMVSSWSAANIGAGSGSYVLGNFEGGAAFEYAADTSPMQAPADYTTSEVTDGSVVVGHDQQCVAGKYRLVGYKWGETLLDAEATTTISTTAPVFTDITTDRYVIVVNEDCDDVIEEEGPEPTSETIVVSPTNMNGWAFFPENTNSGQTGQMMFGPLLAPLGLGSAQFVLTADNQGEALGTVQFAGTRLDDIVSLLYHTYRTTGGAAVAPALQFEFDNDVTDLDNEWRGRLVYEPYHTQTVTTGVWETWDALDDGAGTGTGNWWGSDNALSTLDEVCPQGNPCTWSEVLAAFPDAGVRNNGPLTGLTLFKAGSGWTGGFDGNVDQFVIRIDNGTTDHTKTFDFEPTPEQEPTQGRLIVNKVIVNDDDGESVASDFFFTVNGGSSIQFEADGTNELLLAPGTYTVTENDPEGYDASHADCTNIEVVAGETVTCTITNNDEEEGGGGGGGGFSSSSARRGSVLGATTDTMCEALLSTFMRMGITNDSTEVLELQGFLNEHMAAGLPLTGVFGPLTDAAVHVFQKKYWEDVLKPWFPFPDAGIADADDSTGYVYKTTQWKINDIVCPGVAPFPALP